MNFWKTCNPHSKESSNSNQAHSSTFVIMLQYGNSNVILLILQDFGENKELDNIIANSLQQLENARAFYAQMQEKARTKPN